MDTDDERNKPGRHDLDVGERTETEEIHDIGDERPSDKYHENHQDHETNHLQHSQTETQF